MIKKKIKHLYSNVCNSYAFNTHPVTSSKRSKREI